MKLIPVVSSMIVAVGYNHETCRLVVQFPGDGQTVYWEYLDVPHFIVVQFMFNESLGRAFAQFVKKGRFVNNRITAQQAHA